MIDTGTVVDTGKGKMFVHRKKERTLIKVGMVRFLQPEHWRCLPMLVL